MRRLVLVAAALLAAGVALPASAGVDVPVDQRGKHVCVGTSTEKSGGTVSSYCVELDLPYER